MLLPRIPAHAPAATALILLAGVIACHGHPGAGEPEYRADDPSVLDEDELYQGASTMEELLTGRLPGVNVYRVGGRIAIVIRGLSSVNAGTEALIVVDGVQTTGYVLASMNPKDVARVEVVKDGAAAAYGVRGANGVLLVTTRRSP